MSPDWWVNARARADQLPAGLQVLLAVDGPAQLWLPGWREVAAMLARARRVRGWLSAHAPLDVVNIQATAMQRLDSVRELLQNRYPGRAATVAVFFEQHDDLLRLLAGTIAKSFDVPDGAYVSADLEDPPAAPTSPETLTAWIAAWRSLQARRDTAAARAARTAHLAGLADDLVEQAVEPELTELGGILHAELPPRGQRDGHPTSRILAVVARRRTELGKHA